MKPTYPTCITIFLLIAFCTFKLKLYAYGGRYCLAWLAQILFGIVILPIKRGAGSGSLIWEWICFREPGSTGDVGKRILKCGTAAQISRTA